MMLYRIELKNVDQNFDILKFFSSDDVNQKYSVFMMRMNILSVMIVMGSVSRISIGWIIVLISLSIIVMISVVLKFLMWIDGMRYVMISSVSVLMIQVRMMFMECFGLVVDWYDW